MCPTPESNFNVPDNIKGSGEILLAAQEKDVNISCDKASNQRETTSEKLKKNTAVNGSNTADTGKDPYQSINQSINQSRKTTATELEESLM